MRTVPAPASLKDTPRRTAWCVVDASRTPVVMRCKRCHHTEPLMLPIDTRMLKRLCDAFLRAHRNCEQR